MSIYIIGDPHLSFDPLVDKPMDVFGEEWKDHASRLEEAWRSLVMPEDTVIVAGDISWGLRLQEAMADLEWISALPGKKVMIKGNHDLWWAGIGKLNALFDDIHFLQNECYEAEGVYICGSRGWTCPGSDDFTVADRKIYDREVLRLGYSLEAARKAGGDDAVIIGVTNYPPTNEKKQPSGFTELFSRYGVRKAYYGHLHGKHNYKRGISGVLNGTEYRLISGDSVGFVPQKIEL